MYVCHINLSIWYCRYTYNGCKSCSGPAVRGPGVHALYQHCVSVVFWPSPSPARASVYLLTSFTRLYQTSPEVCGCTLSRKISSEVDACDMAGLLKSSAFQMLDFVSLFHEFIYLDSSSWIDLSLRVTFFLKKQESLLYLSPIV